jgi:hypothetical protein
MKKIVLILLIAGWGTCFAQKNTDVKAQEHITKQFAIKGNAATTTFALYNIWGSVKVEAYNGNDIIIEVDQTINAKSDAALKIAKSEFKLGFDQTADSVIAYTAAPYNTRPRQKNNEVHQNPRQYFVELDYTIKVPANVNIDISTINGGEITVSNVRGKLKVNNINGGITIANAKGATNARTINGPLTVSYVTAPAEACSYYALNGKLMVTYPANYAGDVQFKSLNGSFYTDFDNTQSIVTEATTEKNGKGGTMYKLNKNNKLRIGQGGKLTTFETLNGNIYLKKS